MHRVTLCFFETEEKELRRKPWLDFSSGHHFHLMNTYIYMAAPIYSTKTREELRVMHCSCWFFLVTIFALVVKVKGSPHPLGGWLYRVLSSLLWLWTDGFFALLCMGGIDSFFPYRSLHRPCPSSAVPYICRLPLGLISSGRAEAVGHSISTLCMLSVPALPFFSKGRGNNLSCPPARRK